MITFLFFLPFILIFVVIGVYGERKIASFIQSRYGPMEVGPKGILQTIADLLKMLQKEDIRPTSVDKPLFLVAPIIVFAAIFTGYAVLPMTVDIPGARINSGIFFLMAVVSLDVLGILMAGWGSNNKYSYYGAMRAVAQIVSYEIPLGLSILSVVMFTQTLDLQQITEQQRLSPLIFGISTGYQVSGIFAWNVFQMPILWVSFLIFFIAGLAESNRTPFDLPESESEIIGGYHTEYSGFRWGMFMLSEYAMMLLVSFLASILFFGGWQTPFPNIGPIKLSDWTTGMEWGIFWLVLKVTGFIFIQMWIRWSYPRLRVDQLMSLSWKYLTPVAILIIFIVGIWKLMVI
ncbi:MAG: NADH-quinone oxidoreductase subunit NuoH [Bacteroidota bacterium]